jgi:hypothetical protein
VNQSFTNQFCVWKNYMYIKIYVLKQKNGVIDLREGGRGSTEKAVFSNVTLPSLCPSCLSSHLLPSQLRKFERIRRSMGTRNCKFLRKREKGSNSLWGAMNEYEN